MKKVSVANPSKTVFFSPFRDGLWAVFVLQNQTFSGRPQRTLWKHFLLPSLAQQQIVLLSLLRRCFGLYVTESVSASAPNLKYTWLGAYQQNRRLRTVSVIWINTSEIENIIIYIIIYFFFSHRPICCLFFFLPFFFHRILGGCEKETLLAVSQENPTPGRLLNVIPSPTSLLTIPPAGCPIKRSERKCRKMTRDSSASLRIAPQLPDSSQRPFSRRQVEN